MTAATTLQQAGAQHRGFASSAISALLLALALLFSLCFAGLAADDYPVLTGRITDQANIIPIDTRMAIERKLKDLEDKSSIQLAVATVSSLNGQEIEPYANQLFRTWKLGEKEKNNGVLLLVAPNERRVRIEVGYGLEGTLTDALSKVIITNAMVPRLKTGAYGDAISRGVDDIIAVLTTDTSEWQKKPELRSDRQSKSDEFAPFFAILIFIFVVFFILRSANRDDIISFFVSNLLSFLLGLLSGGGGRGGDGGSWSGGGGGGGFDDSFSGGGGSSGGGGASGDW